MIQLSVFSFGAAGDWVVTSVHTVAGLSLGGASGRLTVSDESYNSDASLTLKGVSSNIRYSTGAERAELSRRQEGLGRPQSTLAALIPISKSAEWWALAQDARRAIFDERSRHHTIGLAYLPKIARKLYHCRDLREPFDFLTWFEYSPADAPLFGNLLCELHATEEWSYVTREIDIRLQRSTKGRDT